MYNDPVPIDKSLAKLLADMKMPQMFAYNSLVCWCTDFSNDGTHAAFTAKFAKPDGDVSIGQFIETIPNDLFFKVLLCVYYGISANTVSVQLLIDEEHDKDALLIDIGCLWSKHFLSAVNGANYLFVVNAARGTNVLHEAKIADTLSDIEIADRGEISSVNVECSLDSMVTKSYNTPETTWFRSVYGVQCRFVCGNYPDVDAVAKGYHISTNQRVLYRMTQELAARVEDLRNYLDRDGLLQLGFRTIPGVLEVTDQSLLLAAVVSPQYCRHFEVSDAFQAGILYRPRGQSIDLPHDTDIDHNAGGVMCQRLATSLMSSPGTLYVPRYTNRTARRQKGFEYNDVYFEPHLASFHDPRSYLYPMSENLTQPNLDEYWLPFDIVPGKIQGLAPINVKPADPQVLIYGRIDRDFSMSHMGKTMTQAALLSDTVRPSYVWGDGVWRYFALLDTTVALDSRCPALYDDPAWPPFYKSGTDDARTVLFNIIYGLMTATDVERAFSRANSDLSALAIDQTDRCLEKAVAGIWATMVDIPNRSDAFLDAYFPAVAEAFAQFDRETDRKIHRSDILAAKYFGAGPEPQKEFRETIDLYGDGDGLTPKEEIRQRLAEQDAAETVRPTEASSVSSQAAVHNDRPKGVLRSFFEGLTDGLKG